MTYHQSAAGVPPAPAVKARRDQFCDTRVMTLPAWRYRTTALALCVALYFASRTGQVAIAALGPDVVATLEIPLGLFGLAFTGLSVTTALVQLPSGVLSDRHGERPVLVAAAALTAGGTLLLALAPTYALFLPLMALVGLGSGLYYSPSTALLDRLFERTGRAIGTYRIGGQAAGAFAPVAVGVVAARYGWRVALFGAGLLLVPVLVGLLTGLRSISPAAPGTSIRTRALHGRLRAVLSRPGLAPTVALASLVQFVEVAAFTFLPTLLRTHQGLAPGVAGGLYGLYFVTVAALQPITGWLSDRVGHRPVTAGTLAAGVIGFGLLARPGPLGVVVAGVVLAGASMTWGTPVQARVVDLLGESERGTGFGLVRTVYLLVGATGSYVVGTLVTATEWTVGVAVLAGLLGVSLLGLGIGAAGRRLGAA